MTSRFDVLTKQYQAGIITIDDVRKAIAQVKTFGYNPNFTQINHQILSGKNTVVLGNGHEYILEFRLCKYLADNGYLADLPNFKRRCYGLGDWLEGDYDG